MVGVALHHHLHLSLTHHLPGVTAGTLPVGMTIGIGMAGITISMDGIPISMDGIPISRDGIAISRDGIPISRDNVTLTMMIRSPGLMLS